MGRPRKAQDLPEAPPYSGRDTPEAPINRVVDQLTRLEGPELEVTTRTTPVLARAVAIGNIYSTVFGSSYVAGRINTNMRLAVSANNGQGREDLIRSLEAGATLPPEYYDTNPDGADYVR